MGPAARCTQVVVVKNSLAVSAIHVRTTSSCSANSGEFLKMLTS